MGLSAAQERVQVVELQPTRAAVQRGRETTVVDGDDVLGVDAVARQQLRHRADAGVAEVVMVQAVDARSEEHTSELQSRGHLVCRLLPEKKKANRRDANIPR